MPAMPGHHGGHAAPACEVTYIAPTGRRQQHVKRHGLRAGDAGEQPQHSTSVIPQAMNREQIG